MEKTRSSAPKKAGRPRGVTQAPFTPIAGERWLPVVDYEGLYEVSDLGRVRSLPRNGTLGGLIRTRPAVHHFRVNLWRDDKMETVPVHTLVARAFLGPRPEGQEVCHGPAGTWVNDLANLSYGTPAKNLGPDKRRDGTMQEGVRNGKAKLDDALVRDIRARHAAGESKHSLARNFDVSRPTVTAVINRDTWRHVA